MTPKERYIKLKEHLAEENPLLVEVIDRYRDLDTIARSIGFLDKNETYTASISWWPLIAILGTFSAGKSSFINEYLGKKVQNTGNQAVDDKFTVICYSKNEEITTLPGVALDADPRFPFYNISTQIEKLDPNDKNINRYLQLKAVKSDKIKGKILIDSPGFDADVQRDAILRITSHIIDLSDLVLIFFDARHPEPGAMRDTLNHLVQTAITHTDADKVLYILNQIDTCAKEDNLEEIIGAWQRALSQKGIVSGKFYAIYNESLAHIEDPELAQRLKKKKDEDLSAITEKMEKVIIDRAYRIAKNIETRAKEIIEQIEPLKEKLSTFKITMLVIDIVLIVIVGGISYYLANIIDFSYSNYLFIFLFFLIFLTAHFKLKSVISSYMSKKIENSTIKKAFIKHTRWVKPYLLAGSFLNRKKIEEKLSSLINASKHFIQKLNDQYINLKKEEHITEA
ncbi:dynamin family protein [Nitratiruptor tergarcus]|uniref:Dynamin family protein n=1 Tax=Nitratiruptor tergarcus DSM 16512 TaxID=1069081 RepID=A0A1W1WTZ6_9BACT|nr:dynamin family protein [Nitratiruptor tergarcus]SMC09665.1 Dynamin family protein [Nitratiruptor tergarcus DSM 16512]